MCSRAVWRVVAVTSSAQGKMPLFAGRMMHVAAGRLVHVVGMTVYVVVRMTSVKVLPPRKRARTGDETQATQDY